MLTGNSDRSTLLTMVITYFGLALMATQNQRRTQTRKKIIKAAKKLFDNHGFDEVTVNQIVKEADVAKGTFYQYYETKIDVLVDLTRSDGVDKSRAALDSVRSGAPVLPVLEAHIRVLCEWFEENENIAAAIVLSTLNNAGKENESDEPERYNRTFIKELMIVAQKQGVLRSDISPMELAKIIGSSLIVSVVGWTKNPVQGALVKSMQVSLKVFLEGATVKDEKAK